MAIEKKTAPLDVPQDDENAKQTAQRNLHDDLDTVFAEANRLDTSKENVLGNPGTNGHVLSSTTAGVRSWVPKEDPLGNPAADGYGLTSTAAGVRSWQPRFYTNMVVITATGNWTRPANITYVFIEVWGGGGGGAGGGTSANGGSGGGGSYGCGILAISSDLSITIGTGGTAGNGGASPTAGGAGGTTSVTGTGVPANFNAGGGAGGTTGGAGAGGTPGAGVTFGIIGGSGDHFGGTSLNHATKGGSAPRGAQGSFTARIPGGGGQGGGFSTAGNVGAAGRVVIWY